MGVKKRIKICVLTFVFATVSLSYAQEASVRIAPSGPTISRAAGTSLALSCIGEGEKPELFEEMRWKNPKGEIILDEINEVAYVSREESNPNTLTLYFQKPTPDATGDYTCSGTYGRSVVSETKISVNFYIGITWEECPLNQAIIVNKQGIIRCRVNANPAAMLTWFKNSATLDAKKFSHNSDGITIPMVTEEDAGSYSVRATITSTGDLDTKIINVEVHVPPKITEFEENYQFVEGDRVELGCQATGYPRPRLYWTNRQLQNLSSVEGYLVNSDTGVLTILKVLKADAGTFKCTAKNSAATVTQDTEVSVIVKPEVRDFENKTVVYGRDVVMICTVTGDPKPRVTIRKDGEDRPIENRDRFILEDRVETEDLLKLTIQSAMRSDDGLYYCAGENKGGKVERVGHLQVEFPPDMSLTTTHSKKTWKEHPVNLSCIAEAIPNATISWTFRGRPIISNELYHIYGDTSVSNLLVKPSTTISGGTDVYGIYRCDARNQYGNNSVEIELTEARVPGRIMQYTVERHTATTITFILRGPQDDGGLVIREFVVQFREKDSDQTAIKTKEWIEGTSYILEELKPRTAYIFSFAAKNDAGIGRFSDDMEFVMPSESTPEIPSFMMPSGTNISRYPDSFQVRWAVPQDNGKKIEYFDLRFFEIEFEGNEYRQVGSASEVKITNWENAPRHNITGLRPNSLYKVELRAKNEIGYSQPASMVFKTSTDPSKVSQSYPPFGFPGSNVEEQKIDEPGSTLTTAAMVSIIIVVVLVILGLIDATCYLRNQCGVFYCLRTAVCGRSPSSEKVKDGAIEDGKSSKDSKNNDHVNEDSKNKSPKGSKSSVAKDSLV